MKESICTRCYHSYVCERFNANRDVSNDSCLWESDHYVNMAVVMSALFLIDEFENIPVQPNVDFPSKCRDCTEFEPKSNMQWLYADDKKVGSFWDIVCANRAVCDAAEKRLKKELAGKECEQ